LASFLAAFLGSLTGGRIGVEDFLGETSGAGTDNVSAWASVGVINGADSEATDGADSGGRIGDVCFVEIG
jgi:hypothetical protein